MPALNRRAQPTAACSQRLCLQIRQDRPGVAAEGHPYELKGLAAVQGHFLSASWRSTMSW
jgi:hypothetical protein